MRTLTHRISSSYSNRSKSYFRFKVYAFLDISIQQTSMGKPERKARERVCSSSSYFLRCFGISRKIHSDKPMVDAGHEKNKKKKTTTRSRWFSRATKFHLKKNCEITPAPIYETGKQNSTVELEDDKQKLFRVIRHVTDRKRIVAAIGHETEEVFILFSQ